MFESVKLCLESDTVWITFIFPRHNEFLISRGSRWMITTLAFWHCACAESPDVINKTIGDILWGIIIKNICSAKDENIFYATIFK